VARAPLPVARPQWAATRARVCPCPTKPSRRRCVTVQQI
jgi:hypothetical protein